MHANALMLFLIPESTSPFCHNLSYSSITFVVTIYLVMAFTRYGANISLSDKHG